MRIFLTGANGQLGRELRRHATISGYELIAMDHGALDITDAWAVNHALKNSGAAIVINAAAYTAVDRAEQEPEMAFAVNRDGPTCLAQSCADLNIPLFHISTDFIFDGQRDGYYREDDPAAPLGVYGLSKWQGEEAVRHILPAHVILRVSWVFGIHGHNFVKTILRLARERTTLQVVADQYGCPTYAGDAAEVLLRLAGRLATEGDLDWGTYHYAGIPPTNWHGLAQSALDVARRYEDLKARDIVPISTADYPTPARRPANSKLDCTRLKERFGIEPRAWLEGLEVTINSLVIRS